MENKDIFNKKGFFLKKVNELDADTINALKNAARSIFPKWSDGFVSHSDIENDERFCEKFIDNDITYYGCSIENMYARGKGNSGRYEWENWLHGKKATINFIKCEKNFVSIINNKLFINRIKDLLQTKTISFHEGSINAIYPGFSGNPNSFYCDSPRFYPSLNISNHKRLNGSLILRVDIDLSDSEDIAPMFFLNESDSQYKYLNSHFAKVFNKNSMEDSTLIDSYPHIQKKIKTIIPNTIESHEIRGIYHELFPDDISKEHKMEESLGSINFINTNLFIRQGANQSEEKIKYYLSLYFSDYDDDIFRDNSTKNGFSENIYNKIDDKILLKKSFIKTRKNNWNTTVYQMPRKIVRKLSLLKNNLIDNSSKETVLEKNINTNLKEYLNVGAHPLWRHPNCVSLDFDPELSEVSFDLEQKIKFPFESNRFKGVYTSHNLEHLKNDSVLHVIRQIHRCLVPGGVLRITVPDIIGYFAAYENNDVRYYDWIRGKDTYMYDSWLRLIVRAFAEPAVDNFSDEELYQIYNDKKLYEFLEFFDQQVENINNKKLLKPDSHKSWHSVDKMFSIFKTVGFSKWDEVMQHESSCKLFKEKFFNMTRPHMSFFVEAIK